MYDFLFQKEFWMDVAIKVAIISGAIGIVSTLLNIIFNRITKLKKILDNTSEIKGGQENTKEVLIEEKEKRRNEHSNLSKEHNQILGELDKTKTIVQSVKEVMLETKAKDEIRYENLTEKQKSIIDSVNHLQQIAGEIKYLQESNTKLMAENQVLISKNRELLSENQSLQRKVEHIAKSMSERYHNNENDMEYEIE